jgi:hypothetical protein
VVPDAVAVDGVSLVSVTDGGGVMRLPVASVTK